MKKLIFLLSLLSLSAFAGSFLNYKDLYEALNIPEEDVTVGVGARIFQKKVDDGLICREVTIIVPGLPKRYSCTIVTDRLFPGNLYEALDINETLSHIGKGERIYKKALPGLVCTKTISAQNTEPKYSCEMNLKF